MNDSDLSGVLSGLLQDPEALSGIMKLAEGFMGGTRSEKTEPPKDPPETENVPDRNAAVLPTRFIGGSSNESCALLAALRPFVSDKRKESIDAIIKILKLTDMASGFLGASGKE